MNITDCPLPSPEVVLRLDLPDYALLFHPLFDEVVALPQVALATWRAVDGRRSVAEIASLVQAQCEDAPPVMAADVAAFLDDLKCRGFVSIEPVEPPPGEEGPKGFLTERGLGVCDAPAISETGILPAKPFGPVFLSLADGSRFHLVALDEPAWRVLAQFAAAACLAAPGKAGAGQTLYLATTDAIHPEGQPDPRVMDDKKLFILQPPGEHPVKRDGRGRGSPRVQAPVSEAEWLWLQLVRLSAFIGQQVQPRGGLLLHSALALAPIPSPLAPSSSVLLAGRSGVGKSTASRGLPTPWRSLSDDVALVVRDAAGDYWAHPWPTWSRIYEQHHDDRWDTQAAVPLRAIFILEQGADDFVRPAAPAEAVSLLVELSQQASRHLWRTGRRRPDIDGMRTFNRQRFDNVCALVSSVPVYLLDVTLNGSFWCEIEQVMALQTSISPT